MARYIDSDRTLKNLPDDLPYKASVRRVLMQAPEAEVAEVRHGRWTLHKDGSGTCSECKKTQKNVWDCDRWQNYCGHCGAKMDKGVTK